MTTDAIVEAIDQLDAIANGVRVEFLRWVARYDDCEGWREDGACSMADWLCYRRGYSLTTARRCMRVAQALKELPRIAEAHTAGVLSIDKTDLLCTIATPDDEAEWVDLASGCTFAYLDWVVRFRNRIKRTDAQQQISERYLHRRHDDDGALRLTAKIPAADGAVVDKALDLLMRGTSPDPVSETYDPAHQRAADALVDLCARRVAEFDEPDRATVVVHVAANELNFINGIAALEHGPPIAAEAARRMSCDGHVQLVASASNGEPIGVGRRARTVPPWLARQIRDRDKGCQFPGCGRTRGVQAHHVVHWSHGGRTDIDNLVSLCRYHHRLVHEGGFRMRKDSQGRIRIVRPSGVALPLRAPSIRPDIRERIFGPQNRRPGRSQPQLR